MKPLLAAMTISAVSLGGETVVQYGFNVEPTPPKFSVAAQIDSRGRRFCLEPYRRLYWRWCELDRLVPWFEYPLSEYVPVGAVPPKWNETGSAVCPEGSDYTLLLMCVPR